MDGRTSKGYAWAVSAGLNAALAAISAKFFSYQVVLISDPNRQAGGHVLAHAATIRLMFRKGKGEQPVCKVFDAPNVPEAEQVFQITAGCIEDTKDFLPLLIQIIQLQSEFSKYL